METEFNDAINNIRRFKGEGGEEPDDIPMLARSIAQLIVDNDIDPEHLNISIVEYVEFLQSFDDENGEASEIS